MMRRLLFAVCLVLILPVTCFASENEGHIRLTMSYGGDAVTGGSVTLYDISGGPGVGDPEELEEYVYASNLDGVTKTIDPEGAVRFDNLKSGLYLLVQKNPPDGFLPMKAFCISIPVETDGKLSYGIEAAPKIQPEKKLPQTGQLVWPAWVLLGAGSALIGLGLVRRRRE